MRIIRRPETKEGLIYRNATDGAASDAIQLQSVSSSSIVHFIYKKSDGEICTSQMSQTKGEAFRSSVNSLLWIN